MWDMRLVISHSIADLMIWIAYTTIPVLAAYIYTAGKLNKHNIAYPALWRWGGAFVFFCSLTHLCGVAEVWIGGAIYYVSAGIKLITAIVSLRFAAILYSLRNELVFISRAILTAMGIAENNKKEKA